MGGGLDSRCVGRVFVADGAVRRESQNAELFSFTTGGTYSYQ